MTLQPLFTKATTILSALWCNLPFIAIAMIGISFLVAFHELGHLIFAKLFDVYAPSFSIGFGPRLFQAKLGETTYALSLIPLGGYVELAGSAEMGQGEQAHAKDTSERSFDSKPYWQKLLIMLGGIGFNLLFSYFALSLLYTMGAPCTGKLCDDKPAHIGAVFPGPAKESGLQSGDTITAVAGTPTPTVATVVNALTPHMEKPVQLTILRGNKEHTTSVTPQTQTIGSETVPKLGLTWEMPAQGWVEGFKSGWAATWALTSQTAGSLMNIFKNHDQMGGTLMMLCAVTQFAGLGFKMLLFILALISVSLAVFNVLPLPIFDGGQVLFFTIEALMGKPLSDEIREKIHYYTWLFVIVLTVYLVIKDASTISRWF